MSSNNLKLLMIAGDTLAIYAFLAIAMRLLSRRQLGQLSALDLLIVILLGSSVETAMVHGSTSLKAGFVSATVLFVANKLVADALRHSKKFGHICGCGPLILVHDGAFVEEHLKRVGMTHEDIMHAIRTREFADLSNVRFAVLEADGQVNVIPRDMDDATGAAVASLT